MKKSVILFAVVLILSLGSVVIAKTQVADELDHVIYKEEVVYGDSSLAKKLDVKASYNLDYDVYWQTAFTPDEEVEAETTVSFVQEDEPYDGLAYIWFEGIHTTLSDLELDMNAINPETLEGIDKVVYELWEEAEPGEEKSKTFYLNEYLETYSFYTNIHLEVAKRGMIDIDTEEYNTFDKKLNEFFQIPVLEDQKAVVTVYKGDGGGLDAFSYETLGTTYNSGDVYWETDVIEEGDEFYIYPLYVSTEDTCFFTFNPYSTEGKRVDTSQIPGGFGIYSFKFDLGKNTLDEESLEMVFPIKEDAMVVDLRFDAAKENMLLFTIEDEMTYVTVIDAKTMQEKQKIACEKPEYLEPYLEIIIDDTCIAVSANESGSYVILSRNADGTYNKEMSAKLYDYSEEVSEREFSIASIDWNGEQLAVAGEIYYLALDPEDGSYYSMESADLYIEIYDRTGKCYQGIYHSSLKTPGYYHNMGIIMVGYPHGVTVQWKK